MTPKPPPEWVMKMTQEERTALFNGILRAADACIAAKIPLEDGVKFYKDLTNEINKKLDKT